MPTMVGAFLVCQGNAGDASAFSVPLFPDARSSMFPATVRARPAPRVR